MSHFDMSHNESFQCESFGVIWIGVMSKMTHTEVYIKHTEEFQVLVNLKFNPKEEVSDLDQVGPKWKPKVKPKHVVSALILVHPKYNSTVLKSDCI